MSARPASLKTFTDAASDALAREIASFRRDMQRERDAFAAEMRAVRAEWEARLVAVSEVERRLADRLASLRDGAPGPTGADGRDGRDGVDGRPGRDGEPGVPGEPGRDGQNGLDGRDGASVSPDDLRPIIAEMVAAAVAEIPAPKDGRDGEPGVPGEPGRDGAPGVGVSDVDIELIEEGRTAVFRFVIGDITHAFEVPLPVGPQGPAGRDGERGSEGPVGKMPVIGEWSDRVHYEGDVVVFDGSAYQACRDTGRAPPHEDWICIARAGRDGVDGRSPQVIATYDPQGEYRELDVVALNGGSFIARRDNPGACPGDGWQVMAERGKPGKPGPVGPRGERGAAVTAAVTDGRVTDQGEIVLRNTDGSEVCVDLYPVLSKLG